MGLIKFIDYIESSVSFYLLCLSVNDLTSLSNEEFLSLFALFHHPFYFIYSSIEEMSP